MPRITTASPIWRRPRCIPRIKRFGAGNSSRAPRADQQDRREARRPAAGHLAEDLHKATQEAAKITEDFNKESAKEAENAAKDAADLAERGAEDGGGGSMNSGSSHLLRNLGESEGAKHDEHGFPVRRGEVVAMDLTPATVEAARARGFRVIERRQLESLEREVFRIGAPAA